MALKECTKKEQANSYELEVNVDGETFGNAVNRVYKKQVKSINIPGFRKGKASRHVIEKCTVRKYFMKMLCRTVIRTLFMRLLKKQVSR